MFDLINCSDLCLFYNFASLFKYILSSQINVVFKIASDQKMILGVLILS